MGPGRMVACFGVHRGGPNTRLGSTARYRSRYRTVFRSPGNIGGATDSSTVFARFDYGLTLPDGSERTSRVLAYYQVTSGRIVVNDVMMVPELMGSPAAES